MMWISKKALRKSKLSDENRLPSLRYGIINGNMNFSYFFTRGDGKEVLKLATNPGRGRKWKQMTERHAPHEGLSKQGCKSHNNSLRLTTTALTSHSSVKRHAAEQDETYMLFRPGSWVSEVWATSRLISFSLTKQSDANSLEFVNLCVKGLFLA